MTSHEIELLSMIREHSEPDKALMTALDIIIMYIERHESVEEQAPVCSQ